MHELSIALEVCRMAEERPRARHPRAGLRRRRSRSGDDAGIELENFRFCLEALLGEPPFAGARPEI